MTDPPANHSLAPAVVLGEQPVAGYRRAARTAVVGRGAADLARLGELVLDWQVQRRSGIRVLGPTGLDALEVDAGLVARISVPLFGPPGPGVFGAELRLVAGVRVVTVLREDRAIGFVYETLRGHPERGEESFVVRLADDDSVLLELRTLSRTALPFALALPVAHAFQERYAARYLRSLLP